MSRTINKTQLSLSKGAIMPPLPQQRNQRQRFLQVNVDGPLYEAALAEIKKRKLYTRHIIEWGMRAFLLNINPKKAQELGIPRPTGHDQGFIA